MLLGMLGLMLTLANLVFKLPTMVNFPFDGILAEGPFNEVALIMADLLFNQLSYIRSHGASRNYLDDTKNS